MSDQHDHPHPHPHPHPAPRGAQGQPTPPVPKQESVEDAGSQALSEALRSSFIIVKVIMVILVVVFFASGFFTVSSQERAIVLRFGKPVGTGEDQLLGPGAHWSFPYPIDEVVRIPYSQFQTVRSTAGWYATTPEAEAMNAEPPAGSTLNPAADGFTLTGDTNIIHVRATLRYRINDPVEYALKFVNASNVVQNALDNALFYASARFNVDEALISNRLGLKEVITERARQLVQAQGLGVTVEQVEIETKAPRYLQPAFESVLSAEMERRQTNDVAQAYASRIRSTAVGEAKAIVNTGETDRTRILQEVASEAKYFNNQLPYYQEDSELFRARLLTEALHQILTNKNVEKFPIVQGRGDQQTEIRLQLSREPQKPQAPATR